MKIGVIFPQTEFGGDPQAMLRFTQASEAMGYEHIVFYDHVVGFDHNDRDPPLWGPYTENDPFHDPFVAFAWLSGLTKTIEFHTGVLIVPQRQTVLLARQAADVDLISNQRLRLGLGTGWNYLEYEALGEDFGARGRKEDEQITFLRKLWTEPGPFTFEGEFHKLVRGNILPRPRRSIPLYLGGFVEPVYRRAARHADGFMFVLGLADPVDDWKRLQAMLREEGRPVEGFGAQFLITQPGVFVDARKMAEHALRLRDAGATEVSLGSLARGFKSLEQHLDFIAEARETVVAALR